MVEAQLQAQTGSRDGPLLMTDLHTHAESFGLDEESALLQEVCSHAQTHRCGETDFVGLVMVQLIMHLTEPPQPGLDAAVRVMLCCLVGWTGMCAAPCASTRGPTCVFNVASLVWLRQFARTGSCD